jgi:hypothetical protein
MPKYKIGFVGEAEVLFAMMAKLLPLDHVTVEEVAPPTPQPTRVLAQQLVRHLDAPKSETFVSKQTGKTYYKNKQYKREPPIPMDLTRGINRIIMEALAHGMARSAIDLRPLVKKGGFSANSVGSRLQKLEVKGVVERMGDGTWRLTDRYLPPSAIAEAGPK